MIRYWQTLSRPLRVTYELGFCRWMSDLTGIYGVGVGRWFFGAVRSCGRPARISRVVPIDAETWEARIKPIVDQCKIATTFGGTMTLTPESAGSLGHLLKLMAGQLDASSDLVESVLDEVDAKQATAEGAR